MDRIPQCNPKASYVEHSADINAAIAQVLSSGRYILGDAVSEFEKQFAFFHNAPYAIGVGNGTDALQIALKACGITSGDGVITTAHSSPATVSAILAVGGIPELVDVDRKSGLLDPQKLEDTLKISLNCSFADRKLKAIIPVHLYGRCADMTAINSIAVRYGLRVIEDCAQAHGAYFDGRQAGTLGDFGCFSFYPTKNLGAIGDGGALLTNDRGLASRAKRLRQYGWERRDESIEPGVNSRLDELQAAILTVKLPNLIKANSRRKEIAQIYANSLSKLSLNITIPEITDGHVFHQFAIRSKHRDLLRIHLDNLGVDTAIHYPIAAHKQPAFIERIRKSSNLNESEFWAAQVFSLPMFPQMTNQQVTHVVEAISTWKA